MSLILKSIEEEATDCRAACADLKVGDWAWLVHHGLLAEPLTEPIENRIKWILGNKTDNVALRLRLLRPLVGESIDELYKARADLDKAYDEYPKDRYGYIKALAEYQKASAELYKYATMNYHRLFPDSPWNGKTIFAGEYAQ